MKLNSNIKILMIWGLLFFCQLGVCSAQESVYIANTQVQLISDAQQLQPGQTFLVGIHFLLDEDWHIYWKNPGDSGLAPMIEWRLPEGWEVEEIIWPYPHQINIDPLVSYGYEHEVVLFSRIHIPENSILPEQAQIGATLKWLVCRIECVGAETDISLDLPVTSDFAYQSSHKIQEFLKRIPRKIQWNFSYQQKDDQWLLKFTPPISLQKNGLFYFYPYRDDVIDHAAMQVKNMTDDGLTLSIKKSEYYKEGSSKTLEGILWVEDEDGGQGAFFVNAQKSESIAKIPVKTKPLGLPIIVMFAFLGGIILNVMPCVLPVLSIKVMSLIEHHHDRQSTVFKEALLFTFGIIFTFWCLAAFVIILRFSGQQLGWGFQFQSPYFLLFMIILFYWLGLSLFGLFEIGSSAGNIQSFFKSSIILRNSFLNGVIATLVATPCTAPFMGTAMGFAFASTPVVTIFIFTFLGLGMAFPYLLLSLSPGLLKYLPKPGIWMVHVKKLFGLLFFVTVLWLVWVLTVQLNDRVIYFIAGGLILLTISGLVIGRWAGPQRSNKERWFARFVSFGLFLISLQVLNVGLSGEKGFQSVNQETSRIKWLKFSPQLIQEMKNNNQSYFIDFTAAWCLTCQVNDKLVFQNQKVIKAFEDKQITMIKADWTDQDDSIAQFLAGYGKSSIPFYLMNIGKEGREEIQFPELLTVEIVLKILNENIN